MLREFAARITKSIRGIDLACRYGGEEFVIVMPETDMAVATMVAERLRRRIATEPFAIAAGRRSTIEVTISIGIAALDTADDNAADDPQARRPGALSRQARRPQPRRRRRGLSGLSAKPLSTLIFQADRSPLTYRAHGICWIPAGLARSFASWRWGMSGLYGRAGHSRRSTYLNLSITLRSAQVRRISWVRGVRPVGGG